ncbi:YpiF family protein [Neobacillus mesonae]|nr:YpiF family protein [Neobacillus mesonae]
MKFSEIGQEDWNEWKPYLDTCIIPLTGLTGKESPLESVSALEKLRDFLDQIETPFKGRIVTYPAFHYISSTYYEALNEVCREAKVGGFKFVMIMSEKNIDKDAIPACDLSFSITALESAVCTEHEDLNEKTRKMTQEMHRQIYQMWGL